jgi:hypothetical protein
MAAAPKFHFDDRQAIDLKHPNEVLRSFSVAQAGFALLSKM